MSIRHVFKIRREQRKKEFKAAHATVTVVRDGRGRVVASK